EGFLPIGFVAAGTLIYFILPLVGWRGVFMWLALPAVFLLVIRRHVPESPRWLESRGRDEVADCTISHIEAKVQAAYGKPLPSVSVTTANTVAAPKGMLATLAELWSPAYARRTLMLWIVWFFTLLGYYGLTSWLGALLQQAGYEVTKSVMYTVVMSSAGIPGFFFAAWLLEAIGRKKSAIFMLMGSAIAAYVYGQCAAMKLPIEQVVMAGLALQFFMFGMWCVIYAYTPELYPTRARATGAGIASSVGRLGSIIGPFGLGLVLPMTGQAGVFAIGAGCFVVSALTIAWLGTETKGKPLEDVSA
ncbi:MAG: MFS transporter, partial [Proteobacteria bacterium]|nr:MFS transporter [Pseudomonadota bacterium]